MSKHHLKARLIALGVIVSLVIGMIGFQPKEVSAAGTLMPTAYDNLVGDDTIKHSYLVAVGQGFMRVFVHDSQIYIEYYDANFNLQSKTSVAQELPLWGGFYAGSDGYYYVVEGQPNTAQSNTTETIRIIKYDKNWKRIKSAKITGGEGGNIRYPLYRGCVEMTECNGKLYIVTSCEGYVDPQYGQGHQGYLLIEVNKSTMTGSVVDYNFYHSFAQYIKADGTNMYVLEQSEGGRVTTLKKYNPSSSYTATGIYLLKYGGTRTSAWSIPCYASVDDMAISSNNVLGVGTSIDQSQYNNVTSDTAHNIYLTVTSKSNFTSAGTSVKWLTNYKGGGKAFTGLHITKINNNRFMICWDEYEEEQAGDVNDSLSTYVMHYLFVDGNGNALSKVFTAGAPVSTCEPIVKNNKVIFYASNCNMVNFYTVDGTSGALRKKTYRVAGEYATWGVSQGVLTVSGSGSMNVDGEIHHRNPLSSISSGYSASYSENSWHALEKSINKIVIGSGITSINKRAFIGFENLTEVEIQSGLQSIGEEVFYTDLNLRKITIPRSVTSIGTDFLWTGYYRVGTGKHITYATIYAPEGSYAAQYASSQGIALSLTEEPSSYVPVGPVGPVDEEKTRAFAIRLYEKCLGRAPEAEGLAHWDSVLKNRERSGAQVAYGFVFSEEYKNKHTTDDQYVEMLYNVFMDRASDAGGKAHWMDMLANGVSREYVFRGFAQSQEYTNICNSYNIERGNVTLSQARDQNPRLTAYVNRMYTQALGRLGEEDGLNHWCRTIQQGVKTPEQVAESFINSAEFRNKGLNDEEYIKVLYRTFMGREYDQGGLDHWKSELARGCSREEILHRFATSAEFRNIQASFGL